MSDRPAIPQKSKCDTPAAVPHDMPALIALVHLLARAAAQEWLSGKAKGPGADGPASIAPNLRRNTGRW
jgi:hypothetical protein